MYLICLYVYLTGVFRDGVCCLLFEECHHDIGVQFKTSHRHQDEERCVGADADEGVVANGDQSRHHCSKHHPGVDGVFPMVGAFKAHYELKYKKETIILMSDIVFVFRSCPPYYKSIYINQFSLVFFLSNRDNTISRNNQSIYL